jgi:hypothetical protein
MEMLGDAAVVGAGPARIGVLAIRVAAVSADGRRSRRRCLRSCITTRARDFMAQAIRVVTAITLGLLRQRRCGENHTDDGSQGKPDRRYYRNPRAPANH